jgi:hypothetical protein
VRSHNYLVLTDLSPFTDATALTTLTLPRNAKDIEFLRVFPKLERIGYRDDPKNGYPSRQDHRGIWNEYDAKKPSPPSPENQAGVPAAKSP